MCGKRGEVCGWLGIWAAVPAVSIGVERRRPCRTCVASWVICPATGVGAREWHHRGIALQRGRTVKSNNSGLSGEIRPMAP